NTWAQFSPARGRRRRRRARNEKFLAEAPRWRSKCGRAEHHARWHTAHHRRSSSEHASELVRSEPDCGGVDDKAVPASGIHVRANDAWNEFSARHRANKTGNRSEERRVGKECRTRWAREE